MGLAFSGESWYTKFMRNFKKPKRYESFKIELWLMDLIRKYARSDGRTIKATIERTMQDGFKARPDDKV